MNEVARYIDPAGPARAEDGVRRAVLFLDRDGVVNVDHGYVHAPEQVRWVDGIFELARDATAAGYGLVVVTNQAGIARGLYDEATFLEFTRWMHARFREAGAPLLATYYCPHHPTAGQGDLLRACQCRKPAPGMLLAAASDLGIDLGTSLLLGDAPSDMAAAQAAGVGLARQVTDGRLPRFATLQASVRPGSPSPATTRLDQA